MVKGKLKSNSKKETLKSPTEDIEKLNNKDIEIVNNVSDVDTKNKIFEKFTIKDIVFLAIVSAVLIITCAVMPLIKDFTKIVFGIAQLVTALQLSLFCIVGLMKVRKVFSLTLILTFMGAIMFAMSPVMGISNVLVALAIELLVVIIFKGYKKDLACFVASSLIAPLGLIVPTIYNLITAPEVIAVTTSNAWVVVGMTAAVTAVGICGSLLGLKISRELTKAGLIKKDKSNKI